MIIRNYRAIFGAIAIVTLLIVFLFLGMQYQKIGGRISTFDILHLKRFPPKISIPTAIKRECAGLDRETSSKDANQNIKKDHSFAAGDNLMGQTPQNLTLKSISQPFPHVILALVACGQKRNVINNTLNLIKSAILFSRDVHLKVILFKDNATDNGVVETIDMQVDRLKKSADALGQSFQYEVRQAWFPDSDGIDWRNMYLTCTNQRHFFATMLPDVDALIYMDTDTIFLGNVKDAWDIFGMMNADQIAGMIAEHEPPADGYYNTRAKLPFYGPRGLNAGVAFMNLTRMRQLEYQKQIEKIALEFKGSLVFADQDMVNIFYARNHHLMFPVPCSFNFRKGHCICDYKDTGACNCAVAENEGILLAHGNIDGFENPPLQIVVDHIKMYDLEHGNMDDLLNSIVKDWPVSDNETLHENTCLQTGKKKRLLSRFYKYNCQQRA